jgi:TM2 domain-containing membrane protein YozV
MTVVYEEETSMSSPVGTTPETYPTLPPPPAVVPVPVKGPKKPVLALVLAMFPGVGQLYNGQTAKAFALFAAFVGSIYLANEASAFFAFCIPFEVFYSIIDAYRNAMMINLRASGRPAELEAVDDSESPAWGALLLGIGLLLLLNNLGVLDLFAVRRFWPLLLVAAGAWFLRRAMRNRPAPAAPVVSRIDDGPIV